MHTGKLIGKAVGLVCSLGIWAAVDGGVLKTCWMTFPSSAIAADVKAYRE